MIVVLKPDARENEIRAIEEAVRRRGCRAVVVEGSERPVLAVLGTVSFPTHELEGLPGVSSVLRVSKPYKLASREVKRESSIVRVGDVEIGGPQLVIMAGPCSVENRAMLLHSADLLSAMGIPILRGGAYKPRTSPYAFQGLGEEGLKILAEARRRTGMKVVTEVMAPEKARLVGKYADILQVGARNMQNFDLLRAVAKVGKPVLLKRGFANTIEEWLMAAEYVLSHGRPTPVILCERGIRTFETSTRNTLDLNAVPVVKKMSHLPVVVDPSHGTGVREYVAPLALAAVAAGADGLILECHPEPEKALSDGPQSLYPEQVARLLRDVEATAPVFGRSVYRTTRPPAPKRARRRKAGRLRAAYQGVAGAFSERAVASYFGGRAEAVPCVTFAEVFEKVEAREVDYGVVPIENSLAGSVNPNYDLLLEHDVTIVGELPLRVVHCLITARGTDLQEIRTVYAHPQAAAQCDRFLRSHRDWTILQTFDTAGSVRYIRDRGLRDAAAIAGADAAAKYDMAILLEGIENDPRNYTRFLVIAKAAADAARGDKTSIAFATKNEPGALAKVLALLARRGINLTKLESRPIAGKPWEYMFFADLEGSTADRRVAGALKSVRSATARLRVFGCYPAAVTSK